MKGKGTANLHAPEDARKSIVVRGGDGVELMIVTAGTRHGQSQDPSGRHVNLVVDRVFPLSFILRAQRQKAGGDDPLIAPVLSAGRQQVPGDLLLDELVVR